jgi:hypothetical protein
MIELHLNLLFWKEEVPKGGTFLLEGHGSTSMAVVSHNHNSHKARCATIF